MRITPLADASAPPPRRKRWSVRAYVAASLAALALGASHVDGSALDPVRGVAPADLAAFEALECAVGGKAIALARDRVNDDYCDCDDGRDEPGTAACSHLTSSKFHCENDGFFPRKVGLHPRLLVWCYRSSLT